VNEKKKEFQKHIFALKVVLISLIEIVMAPQRLQLATFAVSNTNKAREFILRIIQEWFFARKNVLEIEKRKFETKKILLSKDKVLLRKL